MLLFPLTYRVGGVVEGSLKPLSSICSYDTCMNLIFTHDPERYYALGAVGNKDMTPRSNTDPVKVSDLCTFDNFVGSIRIRIDESYKCMTWRCVFTSCFKAITFDFNWLALKYKVGHLSRKSRSVLSFDDESFS